MNNASGNLYLDVAFFGYGVGLVLCGFVAGVILVLMPWSSWRRSALEW